MKRYVIGDIHGSYDQLLTLTDQIFADIGADSDFKIIFVGDYVDRGLYTKECIELIRGLQHLHGNQRIIALMGNREDMLLMGELTYAAETLRSFGGAIPEDVSWWMQFLPKYYEDDTIIVAHAGAQPNVPMKYQEDTWLMWIRYINGQKADLGKHLYHGHTPFLNGPERAVDRTNVGTGCVFGGYPTAAVVGDDGKPSRFIQVKNDLFA